MRLYATTWIVLGVVFIGLGTPATMMTLHGDGSSTAHKAAYRRPASLRQSSADPASDPIWALGQTLFFDPNLASARNLSCASCHKPNVAWTDHLPKARGEGAVPLRFRTPTLLNAGYQERFGWEGRSADIADIAFVAMSSSLNMNMQVDKLLERISESKAYKAAFAATFPDGAISKQNIGAAFTRYVASIASGETPFDRWIDGDETAISASAARGFALFDHKAACSSCHSGWTLSDGSFHDIGLAKGADLGRGNRFKSSVKLQYAFKTPTLKGVADRAPYMHDGSLPTLEAVIDHYDHGGIERPSRDDAVHPLKLSASEKTDLVAFLQTLSGPTQFTSLAQDISK